MPTPAQPATSQGYQKPKVVIQRKLGEIATPSIKQALAGNTKPEEKTEKPHIPEYYTRETRQIDQAFNVELLNEVWSTFANKYSTEVHLYNTLCTKLKLLDDWQVQIEVENSVQQDQVRQLKPEIIGFLRRKLDNSKIDLKIELIKQNYETKILTDDQKLQMMMLKNPSLKKMKSRFNLDFNG